MPPSRLLERDWELAAIERVLADARASVGGLMVIEGDPGSGKSELIVAAERIAAQAGTRVLKARATELERDFPFGLAIQLLEPAWLACDEDQRVRLLAGPASQAAFLFDGSKGNAAERDCGYPIIHGLFWMLCNFASLTAGELGGEPLAILIDDVHWSDPASLRFLAYLAERIDQAPIAMVLTAGAGAQGTEAKVLARLRRTARSHSFQARPLSDGAVATIVRRQFPDAEPAFCLACAHVTGGNPFLLVELLDKLRQEEHAPVGADPAILAQLLPSRVLDAVAARLDAMPDAARALAGAAAVLGHVAPLDLAAAVAEIEPATARPAADALAAERLLQPGVPLSFVHPLVREAVMVILAPLERANVHRRAATILSAEGAGAERVAAHLLEAPPSHDEAAVSILREAARAALASGRAQHAVALLERAREERQTVKLRIELALAQSDALGAEGRYAAAAELLHAELAQPDIADDDVRGELEAAYVAAAALVPGEHREADAIWERMLAGLPAQPGPRQRRALAHSLAYQAFLGTPHAEVRRRADLAWAKGASLEDEAAIGLQWPLLLAALMFVDEVERCIEICDVVLAHGPSGGLGSSTSDVRCCRAWGLYEQGRITAAAAQAAAALAAPPEEQGAWVPLALAVRVGCEIERGEIDEAEAALAQLGRSPLPTPMHLTLLLALRSRLRLSEHRAHEALRDALDAAEALGPRFGSASPGAIPWRSTAALAHLALGEPDRASGLAEAELSEARRLGVTRLAISNLRVLGLAAGGQAGIELLEQAVETGTSHPARLEHVRALVDLGAALRRANRRAAAREPLRRGLALAQRHGATVLARRAHTELRATNPSRNHENLTGVSLLTASQRRVAELAAGGLTSRQIAEALFVRPKTVEFHLRQIYRRLNISGREQLGARLGIEHSNDEPPQSR